MDVDITNESQKKIRAVIRSDYSDKNFDQHELLNIMSTIVDSIDSNEKTENAVAFIIQYLFYNQKMEKYYFNLKRKTVATKEPFMEKFYTNNIKLKK